LICIISPKWCKTCFNYDRRQFITKETLHA
jgi:hypothetical protein